MVEKARAIQQNKKTAVKDEGTLRRSSRTEATKRSYCEDEVQLKANTMDESLISLGDVHVFFIVC